MLFIIFFMRGALVIQRKPLVARFSYIRVSYKWSVLFVCMCVIMYIMCVCVHACARARVCVCMFARVCVYAFT